MTETSPAIDARRAVFLVMDYQVGIVERIEDATGLLQRASSALSICRAGGVRVGYVRVAFADADYATVPETNKTFSAIATGRVMHDEAPETAVHDDVRPEADDIIVRKTRVGAFSTTDLDRQLRDLDVDTLVLAGISTSGVVLSTVRDGADRDYRLYVLEDACADTNQEAHEVLTRQIFPRQAYVISVAELPALLRVP